MGFIADAKQALSQIDQIFQMMQRVSKDTQVLARSTHSLSKNSQAFTKESQNFIENTQAVSGDMKMLSGDIKKKLEELSRVTEEIRNAGRQESVSAPNDLTESLKKMEAQLSVLSRNISRHDMTIEDMVDSWGEQLDQQKAFFAGLESSQMENLKNQMKQGSDTQEQLLKLVMGYQNQFFAFRKAAAEDESWERQLRLADEKLAGIRTLCGFETVEERNVPVNYDIHQVIEAVPTPDEEKDKQVAEVYQCGYVFQGRVLQKAAVAAYRYTAEAAEEILQETADAPSADSAVRRRRPGNPESETMTTVAPAIFGEDSVFPEDNPEPALPEQTDAMECAPEIPDREGPEEEQSPAEMAESIIGEEFQAEEASEAEEDEEFDENAWEETDIDLTEAFRKNGNSGESAVEDSFEDLEEGLLPKETDTETVLEEDAESWEALPGDPETEEEGLLHVEDSEPEETFSEDTPWFMEPEEWSRGLLPHYDDMEPPMEEKEEEADTVPTSENEKNTEDEEPDSHLAASSTEAEPVVPEEVSRSLTEPEAEEKQEAETRAEEASCEQVLPEQETEKAEEEKLSAEALDSNPGQNVPEMENAAEDTAAAERETEPAAGPAFLPDAPDLEDTGSEQEKEQDVETVPEIPETEAREESGVEEEIVRETADVLQNAPEEKEKKRTVVSLWNRNRKNGFHPEESGTEQSPKEEKEDTDCALASAEPLKPEMELPSEAAPEAEPDKDSLADGSLQEKPESETSETEEVSQEETAEPAAVETAKAEEENDLQEDREEITPPSAVETLEEKADAGSVSETAEGTQESTEKTAVSEITRTESAGIGSPKPKKVVELWRKKR